MKWSTILNKVIMAITGLALVGFLISHLTGNLKLYLGSEEFNHYAKFLEDLGPALYVAEIGLVTLFLVHIIMAIKLTLANKAARPIGYGTKTTAGESTLGSRTMFISGLVILIFVFVHVSGFKYGDRPGGSLWQLVVDKFSNPGIAAFYVVCMLFLGMHLSHGIASAFQSLGLRNSSGHPKLRYLGPLLGWGIALGFASFPLWVLAAKPVSKTSSVKIEIPAGK